MDFERPFNEAWRRHTKLIKMEIKIGHEWKLVARLFGPRRFPWEFTHPWGAGGIVSTSSVYDEHILVIHAHCELLSLDWLKWLKFLQFRRQHSCVPHGRVSKLFHPERVGILFLVRCLFNLNERNEFLRAFFCCPSSFAFAYFLRLYILLFKIHFPVVCECMHTS